MSELTKASERGGIVGASGLGAILEIPQIPIFPVYANVSGPFVGVLPKRYSLETAFVVGLFIRVLLILGLRGDSKIGATVVKGLSRLLVVSLSWIVKFKSENLSMHWYRFISAVNPYASHSIKRLCIFAPRGKPIPLHEPVVVASIDESVLTLRERNEAVRLILRLNNRLAEYATFGHDLTSNEIAAFSRFSILTKVGAPCL